MSNIQNSSAQPITLDFIYEKIKYWRDHKKEFDQKAMPDQIWGMIFTFQKQKDYSDSEIKKLFSLNSQQYSKKYTQLMATEENKAELSTSTEPAQFSEVEVSSEPLINVVPSLTGKVQVANEAVAHLKSPDNSLKTYVDIKTIVVEYIRPDGHRLKIHTTTSSIADVMQAFGKEISV